MSKFYGVIGYGIDVEKERGVWVKEIVEKPYKGEIISRSKQIQNGNNINDDIKFLNQVSIIADPYAFEHYGEMIYFRYNPIHPTTVNDNKGGFKWKITNIDLNNYPRINITTGGLYNENENGLTN